MSLSDKIQAAVTSGCSVDLSHLDIGWIDLQGWIDDFEASSDDAILTVNADSLSPNVISLIGKNAAKRVRLIFNPNAK